MIRLLLSLPKDLTTYIKNDLNFKVMRLALEFIFDTKVTNVDFPVGTIDSCNTGGLYLVLTT